MQSAVRYCSLGGRSILPVLLLGLASAASGQVNLGPSQDTFITENSGLGGGSSTHETSTVLYTISAALYRSYPMIEFDLTSFAGHIVTGDATLTLRVASLHPTYASEPRAINAYPIDADWDASTVNFDDFTSGGNPLFDLGTLLDSIWVTEADIGTDVSLNVPAAVVQGWIDDPSHSFGIGLVNGTTSNRFDVTLASAETVNPPVLSIQTTVPVPALSQHRLALLALLLACAGVVAMGRKATVLRSRFPSCVTRKK